MLMFFCFSILFSSSYFNPFYHCVSMVTNQSRLSAYFESSLNGKVRHFQGLSRAHFQNFQGHKLLKKTHSNITYVYDAAKSKILYTRHINTECPLCRERVVARVTNVQFKCAKIDILNSSTFKQ